METLSCHSNETTCATAIKNILYVEDDNTNIYAKFRLHFPYKFFEKKISEYFFFKNLTFLAAMATNQNQRFGQNSYGL